LRKTKIKAAHTNDAGGCKVSGGFGFGCEVEAKTPKSRDVYEKGYLQVSKADAYFVACGTLSAAASDTSASGDLKGM